MHNIPALGVIPITFALGGLLQSMSRKALNGTAIFNRTNNIHTDTTHE